MRAKRIISLAFDSLFILALLFFAIVTIGNLILMRNNKVPFVLGFTSATVLSPSMTASGFEVGDTVILKQVNPNRVEIGDAVSYYYFSDINNPQPDVGEKLPNTHPSQSASEIWFHHVIDIITDQNGARWFQMQGSSNRFPDAILIREDCLIGRYVAVPKFLTNILGFFKTPIGMITFILIPSLLLMTYFIILVLRQIKIIQLENLVLNRKIALNHGRCIKYQVGRGLSQKNKELVLSFASSLQKEQYARLLYGNRKYLKMLQILTENNS